MRERLTILVIILIIYCSSCTPKTTTNEAYAEKPIAISFIEENKILFECQGTDNCISPIDLNQYGIDNAEIMELGSIFYCSPDSICLILRTDLTHKFLRLNLHNEQVEILDLDEKLDFGYFWATQSGKIILANKGYRREGHLWAIDKDLSIQNMPLDFSGTLPDISNLIVSFNDAIIVLNGSPVEEDGKIFAEAYTIDTRSLEAAHSLMEVRGLQVAHGEDEIYSPGSDYIFRITNTSPDLRYLYFFYHHYQSVDETDFVFGKFDVQNFQAVTTTGDLGCNALNLIDNVQYKNAFFTNKLDNEGNARATLMDLDSLQMITDEQIFSQTEQMERVIIAPFGEHFLIGTPDTIRLITQSGEVLDEYIVPEGLQNKKYVFVEYRE